jgi:hypothetical protein
MKIWEIFRFFDDKKIRKKNSGKSGIRDKLDLKLAPVIYSN